jgi:hypothetical protein
LFSLVSFYIRLSIEFLKFQYAIVLVSLDKSSKNCLKLSSKRGTLGGTFFDN